MGSSRKQVSPSVVKRLPRYLARVQALRANGVEWVSSQELADQLGLTSSTVRQDFSCLDFSGISKRGYEICGLEEMLTYTLGADKERNVVVVGAGNLGRALVLHEDFSRRGFNIVAVFDNDPEKIGSTIGALTVQSMKSLPSCVSKKKITMGIVAVPAKSAQSVADLLIVSGVKGLLNMALTHIVVPSGVSVVASRLVASMLELSHHLSVEEILPAS